jgi:hypothetical protein
LVFGRDLLGWFGLHSLVAFVAANVAAEVAAEVAAVVAVEFVAAEEFADQ